jgi:CRP-like cAMP-binding protein
MASMSGNYILQRLGAGELATLLPRLTPVELRQGDVLVDAGALITHVYFVESGLVSLLSLTRDGQAVETGLIGPEGMVGSTLMIGAERAGTQAVVQIPGRALKGSASAFMDGCRTITALRQAANRQLRTVLLQAQQNATCRALHPLEARLARWLLHAQDALHSQQLELTQEFLSDMLSAQRTSISVVAHRLQVAGLIRYRRGRIEVTDRAGLETLACECYGVIKGEIAAALPASPHSADPILSPRTVTR